MKTLFVTLFSLLLCSDLSHSIATTPQKTITITSTSASAGFTPAADGFNLPWIGTASKGNLKNLVADPYFTLVKNLGIQSISYPSIGALARYVHPGSTVVVSSTVAGTGYNMRPVDFVGTNDTFATFDGGVGPYPWTVDFATTVTNFKNQLPLFANTVCVNPQNGTYDEAKALIIKYAAKRVVIGAELVGTWDPDSYKAVAQDWINRFKIDFPGIIICVDEALPYKTTPKNQKWMQMISTLTGYDELRYYAQANDRCNFTSDATANLAALQSWFNVLLPGDINTLLTQCPGKRINVSQFLLEDNDNNIKNFVNNTMLGDWAIGQFYVFSILHPSISFVSWMSLRNLINSDVPTANYAALKQCNEPLLTGKFGCTTAFANMPGVTGAVLSDGGTQFYLYVNNSTATSYTVDNIIVNGKVLSASLSVKDHHAADWNSPIIEDNITTTRLTIQGYYQGVVSFTTTAAN